MRVACFAWDSPDLDLLREGVAEGWLPTLASLADRGSFALLDDTQEILTPASWPTLVRGVPPGRHLLLADRQLVPGAFRVASVSAEAAVAPPFWAHLGAAGLRSAIMGIYSAPLVPSLPGVQVIGWGSHDPFTTKHDGPRAEPPEVLAELRKVAGKRTLTHGRRLPRTQAEEVPYVAEVVRGLDQQSRALVHLAQREPWDFLFGTFADGHEAGHVLWRHHDTRHPDHDPQADPRLRRSLREIARATDRALAGVLAVLDEDDAVLVVTPYGMGRSGHLGEAVEGVLRAGGWLADRAPGGRARDRRAATLGLARTVGRAVIPARWRPAVARLTGNVAVGKALALADLDPSRTRAFALPSDGPGLVRVNLAGREPAGAVEATDYETVRDELIAAFGALRDADSGEPVAARVARFEEFGGCEPEGPMPDVAVAWRRGMSPRSVRLTTGGEVLVPREVPWGSIHWCTGFVLGAGPGIPAGGGGLEGPTGRLVDLAATVLALLRVPQPPELTGTPLFEAAQSNGGGAVPARRA